MGKNKKIFRKQGENKPTRGIEKEFERTTTADIQIRQHTGNLENERRKNKREKRRYEG